MSRMHVDVYLIMSLKKAKKKNIKKKEYILEVDVNIKNVNTVLTYYKLYIVCNERN